MSEQPRCHGDWPDELVDLYVERRAALVRLAYLLTGHSGAAEELVQDAFLASAARWAEMRNPPAYLRAAVVNHCRSWGRRQQVEERVHLAATPSEELEVDHLWDALGRLDGSRRAAIVLRYYEGLPDREIARLLGCRAGTVRSRINRGLKDLRREIEP